MRVCALSKDAFIPSLFSLSELLSAEIDSHSLGHPLLDIWLEK